MRVVEVSTYPVKGLRPIRLEAAELQVGRGMPNDREWALLLGSAAGEWDEKRPEGLFGSDASHSAAPIKSSPAAPLWHGSKYKFHQLINSPELARIEVVAYDAEDGARLVAGGPTAEGQRLELDARLATPEGFGAAEQFFATFLKSHGRLRPARDGDAAAGSGGAETGAPSLCHARAGTRHQFGNVGGLQGEELLHIVCLPSVRALDAARARAAGAAGAAGLEPTDPGQFRANLYLDGEGLQPFEEQSWCGRRLKLGGDLELEILEPTIRCPASSVHPERGVRERNVAQELRELFPANAARIGGQRVPLGGPRSRGGFMGVYARVVRAGTVRAGDAAEVLDHGKGATLAAAPWVAGFVCVALGVALATRYVLGHSPASQA